MKYPDLRQELISAIRRAKQAQREYEAAKRGYELLRPKSFGPFDNDAVVTIARFRSARRERTAANELVRRLSVRLKNASKRGDKHG